MEWVPSTAVTQNASQARCIVDMPWLGLGCRIVSSSASTTALTQGAGVSMSMAIHRPRRVSDHRDFIKGVCLTARERRSYQRMMVAGWAVDRGRMAQAPCLELDRPIHTLPALGERLRGFGSTHRQDIRDAREAAHETQGGADTRDTRAVSPGRRGARCRTSITWTSLPFGDPASMTKTGWRVLKRLIAQLRKTVATA